MSIWPNFLSIVSFIGSRQECVLPRCERKHEKQMAPGYIIDQSAAALVGSTGHDKSVALVVIDSIANTMIACACARMQWRLMSSLRTSTALELRKPNGASRGPPFMQTVTLPAASAACSPGVVVSLSVRLHCACSQSCFKRGLGPIIQHR
jgi:hypothetical protein